MYSLLIVEDERMAREALVNLVPWEDLGFSVVGVFRDGTECLEYLSKQVPDVILSDIKMARTSGIEIARFVHEHNISTRVVFMSAYREFELAQKAVEYGVKYYLLKPISMPELYKVMEKLRNKLDETAKVKSQSKTTPSDILHHDQNSESSVDRVMKYISEHFCEDISLNALAEKLYLNPGYVSRMLKTQLGKNYTEIIAEKRIELAVWYLENTGLFVYEIAERVGYRNLKYFYVIFKKVTGKTPNDYRGGEDESKE